MIWQINILAAEQRRVLSRVLQVVENQMVRIHSFYAKAGEANIYLSVTFSSDQDKTSRIQALLYRLEDIVSVSVNSQS